MCSPQLEDGYIKIANELFDALVRIRIPGEARQMLDFIIRKTYGFNKKHDMIATSQIMDGTGLSKRAVEKSRKKLREMNLISTPQKGGTFCLSYSVNKHYKTWIVPPKKAATPQKGGKVPPKMGAKYPPKGGIQKTEIHKDTEIETEGQKQFRDFYKKLPKARSLVNA